METSTPPVLGKETTVAVPLRILCASLSFPHIQNIGAVRYSPFAFRQTAKS